MSIYSKQKTLFEQLIIHIQIVLNDSIGDDEYY